MMMSISSRPFATLAVFAAFLVALPVEGADQAKTVPGPPAIVIKNLQVLPKDIKPEQLTVVMHGYATGLGVDCNFCHTNVKLPPGKTLPPGADELDYSLDDKPTKRIARQMILMVRTINAMAPVAVGKPPEKTVSIQCYNCHRGLAIPPLPLADILNQETAAKGRVAAIAFYKDLRKKKLAAGEYDFADATAADGGSRGLESYAFQQTLLGKPDDALAWLNVNLEFYPRSAPTWAAMAFTQAVGKHDRAGAISSLRKAIALDPQATEFKDALKLVESLPP